MSDQPTSLALQLKHPLTLIDVVSVDDALLRLQAVSALTGLSRSTIYTRMSATPPTFPQAIKQGKRCTRWRAGDIRAFLQSLAK